MKKLFSLICLAALVLAVAGCGGQKNSEAVVPENTVVAAYIDIERTYDDGKSLAKEVIQALPSEMRDKAKKGYEEAIKKIDEIKDPLNPEWAVITFGGSVKTLSKDPDKCFAFAVRINANEDAVTKVLKKHASDEDAVTIEKKNGNVIYRDAKDDDHMGLVDGKYLIGAASKEAFEEMFDLYAGNGRASEEFDDLSRISGDTICRIQTAPVSSLLKRFELEKYVEKFGKDSQDEELSNMILNMGPVSLDIALAEGGELVLRVECASSDDAEMVDCLFQLLAFANRATCDGFLYAAEKGDSNKLMQGFTDFLKSDIVKDIARSANKASRSGKTAEIRSGFLNAPLVLASFVSVAVPVVKLSLQNTRIDTARMLISNVDIAVKSYYLKHAKYPESINVLTMEQDNEGEPFLEGDLVDPWGNELRYEKNGKKRPKITSAGPDGEFDTYDDIKNYDEKKKTKF